MAIFTGSVITSIITAITSIFLKFIGKKKEESDKARADVAEKALETVGDSIKVEKEIKEKQKNVKEIDVLSEDGGFNFDDINNQ